MDPELTASLCIAGREEAGRELGRGLLKSFSNVKYARCRIDGVTRVEEGYLRVPTELCMEGVGVDGQRQLVRQAIHFESRQTPDGWKIVDWTLEEPEVARGEPVVFREEARERGLDREHRSRGVKDRWGFFHDYLAGSGLAIRDLDGDTYEDLLVVNGDSLMLFRNREGRFEDVTREWGLESPPEGECRLGIFGDIDNDGDPDLFVGVTEGPNYLYLNEGGRYRRILADDVGLRSSGQTTSACFADFDGDGLLDLFVASGMNLLKETPEPIFNAKNALPNQLFRNLGDGRFEDVTERAGVGDPGWALSCTTVDHDGDGDLDLYVANDFGRDCLYENQGNFRFENVTVPAGLTHFGSSMGAAFSDVDGDGDQDLFISGMASGARWMLDLPEFPLPANWFVKLILKGRVTEVMREMLHGNRFYLNQGDGTFAEVSSPTGTRDSGWAWGGIIFDYDNDGRDDVYVLNGFRSGKDKDDL